MSWFHNDCVNEQDNAPGVWMCTECRTLPTLVKTISAQMSHICQELTSLQATNMELVHALGRKSLECDRLQKVIDQCNFNVTNTPTVAIPIIDKVPKTHTNPSPAIKSTIIGSSIVRAVGTNINSENVDAVVYVNPGRDLPKICSHIPNMLKDNPDIVVLQAGSIDVTEHNAKDIIYEYDRAVKTIMSATNDITTIFLSTIPIRRNHEHDRRASKVNNYIRHITSRDHRLQLVENNNIRLQDLHKDGNHLSDQGTGPS